MDGEVLRAGVMAQGTLTAGPELDGTYPLRQHPRREKLRAAGSNVTSIGPTRNKEP